MIELKDVCKKYGNNSVYEKFNLEIEEGKITAILGENGSGKTTLVKILSGLIDYTGEITGLPDRISFCFQEDRLVPNLTVKENIKLVSPDINVEKLLEELGLGGSENKYIKEFSGGKKRKIAIARAISFDAPLLILDEPFSSVDIASREFYIKKIKKLNKDKKNTVLFITHDILDAVKIADRIIVLSNGKCVYDKSKFDRKTEHENLYKLLIRVEKTKRR